MPVHVVKGNLLKSDCDVIIQQCNCQGVMGAGIAKQIVNLYPSVLDADRAYKIPLSSRKRLGHTSHAWVDGPHGRLLVVNLYGQQWYGRGKQTEEDAFERGLCSILKRLNDKGGSYKIGLPYGIGAGLAGGDWMTILQIIKDCAEKYHQEIYLYKL